MHAPTASRTLHRMRPFPLSRAATALALLCLALSACGGPGPADTGPAGSAVSAGPAKSAVSAGPVKSAASAGPADDAEVKFLELATRIGRNCSPDAPSTTTPDGGAAPRPEDLPGGSSPSPRHPAGATPPGTPDAEGDIPVDTGDNGRPAPDSTQAAQLNEVPLSAVEACTGQAHAQRITDAFAHAGTSDYTRLAGTLTTLGYPAARIHRMPDQSGSPRARLDLRVMGGRLALEITAARSTAAVEAFGAPESEDIDLTRVTRRPVLDAPSN